MAAYPDWDTVGIPAVHTVTTPGVTTITIPARANAVLLQSSANNAMVTLQGTTPTATVGVQLVADAEPVLLPLSYHASALKLIREGGSDATVVHQFVRVKKRNWM